MIRKFTDKSKEELIVLASNSYASLQSVSKLYMDMKTEYNYLSRRNNILEKRIKHLKDIWEKKNGCRITFDRIDAIIKREEKLKGRPKIKFEEKGVGRNGRNGRNNNAKIEGIQS